MMGILDFFLETGALKKIKRTGWLKKGIPHAESVADHCFRNVVIALVVGTKLKVNLEHLLQMTIIHDLAETEVGDLTPYDEGYSHKLRKELNVMERFGQQIDIDLLKLWTEYEEGETPEAKICKQIDKFEMILQAFEYEKAYNINMEEFWQAEKEITIPILKEMLSSLRKR